jgi:hypothetical protein
MLRTEHRERVRVRGRKNRTTCLHCGTQSAQHLDAVICCLYVPVVWKPEECAWCGDPIRAGLTFCNRDCSVDYAADVRVSL